MIKRTIQPAVEKKLFQGKIIIIYGARQVGKTTLLKEFSKIYPGQSLYLNCDEPDVRESLTGVTSTVLKAIAGKKKLLLIDEAQRVTNIGITLKLFADNLPEIQVVVTGSSSFELSNRIVEPLTGRKTEFYLYPFSLEELSQIYSGLELKRLLGQFMVTGLYPQVVLNHDQELLREITRSYLYKDILQFQQIKNSDALEKLLKALALQIGSEVSYNELAGLCGIDKKTVETYLAILEKAFIIYRLNPYSTNKRNELKRLRKIYFYDTGIRNALINNLNPLDLRQDTGALWENFLISERKKMTDNHRIHKNTYFWRNLQQMEIDYIEEENGKIEAYEFKLHKKNFHIPKDFSQNYPECKVSLINQENFQSFVNLKD